MLVVVIIFIYGVLKDDLIKVLILLLHLFIVLLKNKVIIVQKQK